jgi:hypothetical protein
MDSFVNALSDDDEPPLESLLSQNYKKDGLVSITKSESSSKGLSVEKKEHKGEVGLDRYPPLFLYYKPGELASGLISVVSADRVFMDVLSGDPDPDNYFAEIVKASAAIDRKAHHHYFKAARA